MKNSTRVVTAAKACTHPAYICLAEKRGDQHVLVCPCGHVRVCHEGMEAMVWSHVYAARLAREIQRAKLIGGAA